MNSSKAAHGTSADGSLDAVYRTAGLEVAAMGVAGWGYNNHVGWLAGGLQQQLPAQGKGA